MGGNPERSPMECGRCGQPATTRIPSGFACSACALEAFLAASADGDTSWVPKLIDPPRIRLTSHVSKPYAIRLTP